jgi:HD-like signal output (HDOD) protein
MITLKEFVESARVPVMPEMAAKLIPTLTSDTLELAYLRDVIAKDPGLTATVLRWANSPLHGMSRSVTTLDAAVSILGLSKIRAQAIAVCVSNAFELPAGMERQKFWAQSMKCAGYSMWLALAIGLDESEAWLTGMLMHLGEVVIFRFDADAARQLSQSNLQAVSRWRMEQDLLGVDDGQVMGAITALWEFPQEIVRALQCASNPMEAAAFSRLGGVVHLASILSEMDSVNHESLVNLPPDLMARLGVDAQWLSQYIPDPATFLDTSAL